MLEHAADNGDVTFTQLGWPSSTRRPSAINHTTGCSSVAHETADRLREPPPLTAAKSRLAAGFSGLVRRPSSSRVRVNVSSTGSKAHGRRNPCRAASHDRNHCCSPAWTIPAVHQSKRNRPGRGAVYGHGRFGRRIERSPLCRRCPLSEPELVPPWPHWRAARCIARGHGLHATIGQMRGDNQLPGVAVRASLTCAGLTVIRFTCACSACDTSKASIKMSVPLLICFSFTFGRYVHQIEIKRRAFAHEDDALAVRMPAGVVVAFLVKGQPPLVLAVHIHAYNSRLPSRMLVNTIRFPSGEISGRISIASLSVSCLTFLPSASLE